MRNNQPVTDHEYVLGEDQYLISHTDLDSHITYANPAFVEVSGFDWEELVGSPHNLIRHPDMPPEAFANFWETIRDGEAWTGMVKNRRKNGDYYWVHATVTPIVQHGQIIGYASVRRPTTEREKDRAGRIYGRMRAGKRPGAVLSKGVIVEKTLSSRLGRLVHPSLGVQLFGLGGLGVLGIVVASLLGVAAINELSSLVAPGAATEQAAAIETRLAWMLALLAGGFGLVLLGLAWRLSRRFMGPLRATLAFSRQVAAGNLITEIDTRRQDALGELMRSLNVMRCSLMSIVRDVKQGTDVVGPEAVEIARGNQDLSRRTEAQTEALAATSRHIEQLIEKVAHSADNAQSSSTFVDQASTAATRGGREIGQMVESMRQINGSSEEIQKIIGMIDDIAFQTNILALNASVEAARAGVHGRGFAVVADEVRALAQRSAESAQQIKTLIGQSSRQVQAGSAQADESHQIMDDIVASVTRANGLMQDVSRAAIDQRNGIEEIREAVAGMDDRAKQDAALVQESAASANALSEQAHRLGRSVSIFRVETEAAPAA